MPATTAPAWMDATHIRQITVMRLLRIMQSTCLTSFTYPAVLAYG